MLRSKNISFLLDNKKEPKNFIINYIKKDKKEISSEKYFQRLFQNDINENKRKKSLNISLEKFKQKKKYSLNLKKIQKKRLCKNLKENNYSLNSKISSKNKKFQHLQESKNKFRKFFSNFKDFKKKINKHRDFYRNFCLQKNPIKNRIFEGFEKKNKNFSLDKNNFGFNKNLKSIQISTSEIFLIKKNQ